MGSGVWSAGGWVMPPVGSGASPVSGISATTLYAVVRLVIALAAPNPTRAPRHRVFEGCNVAPVICILLQEVDLAATLEELAAGFALAAGMVVHVYVERNFNKVWSPCARWRST